MIPEDDQPASWLRDYGGIEADIRQLRDFATRLDAEVRQNYAPHLSYIADDVSVALPDPCDAFVELVHFLQAHRETQQATTDLVYTLGGATGGLAVAAGQISDRYAGADAFSAARVEDVERALRGAAVTPTRPDPPTTPPGREVLP